MPARCQRRRGLLVGNTVIGVPRGGSGIRSAAISEFQQRNVEHQRWRGRRKRFAALVARACDIMVPAPGDLSIRQFAQRLFCAGAGPEAQRRSPPCDRITFEKR